MRRTFVALFSSALFSLPLAAFASTMNLSTGVADYYATAPTGPCSATSCLTSPVVGNPGWGASISGATWVNLSGTDDFNADNPNGAYVFSTEFTVTTNSILTGSFASDNDSTLVLYALGSTSGTTLGFNSYGDSPLTYSFNTLTPFNAMLTPDLYALVWYLNNGQPDPGMSDGPNTNGPVGLLVGASVTPVTPEPSSLVLLGSGVLGLAGVARRRFVEV